MCETAFRLCVLRDRFQTCPFLFFLSLPPWGKVPPKGADEGPGSRTLSCRGAHCAPAFFAQTPPQGRVSSPARQKRADERQNPKDVNGVHRRRAGACPRRPFCRARPPGRAARACHVSDVGAAHRAARQQAHSAPIPNICIQTSHKGPNSSLFERGQSLPCKREGDRRRRWRDSISQ